MLLLKLYPRSWRERYGDEVAELVRRQGWSPALLVDLVAGAVDARLHPQVAVPHGADGADVKGEKPMFAKVMKLRCAGYGPNVTPRDQWLSVTLILGGTLVLSLIWVRLHGIYGDNAYIDSLSYMAFLIPYTLTMPLTSLKGRSRGAQAVVVGGTLLGLTAIALVTGFIASRL